MSICSINVERCLGIFEGRDICTHECTIYHLGRKKGSEWTLPCTVINALFARVAEANAITVEPKAHFNTITRPFIQDETTVLQMALRPREDSYCTIL